MKIKIIARGFLVIFLIILTSAQIEIKKTAPQEITLGEILEVKIEVWNRYNETLSVTLKEIIDFGEPLDKEFLVQLPFQNITKTKRGIRIGNIEWLNPDEKCEIGCVEGDNICDPDCECTSDKDLDCAVFANPTPPRYEWSFVLNASFKREILYRVKPFLLGEIEISPTRAETIKGTFYSNSVKVKIKCNPDGSCGRNENFQNCPQDCLSGSPDDYCDKVEDGICDPDCFKSQDPDCLKEICGDGVCELEKGENYKLCPRDCEKPIICGDDSCDEKENYGLCPQDCLSGSPDNYCDGIKDGICDLDCPRELDEDCFCNKDGICEIEWENFLNCPQDCLSGSKDGYCDKVEDGICDADCQKEEDVDCQKESLLWYIIIGLIGLIILFIIYKKVKS